MKEYNTIEELFDDICKIKRYVIKLKYNDLYIFKKQFYNQKFQEWKLNILWEYIWNDRSYNEIKLILKIK